MYSQHENFAAQLVSHVINDQKNIRGVPKNRCKVMVPCADEEWASIALTPFSVAVQPADAKLYFAAVSNVDGLLDAYTLARQIKPFEEDLAHACDYVSDYASEFLQTIFNRARHCINDEDARRIAAFVSNLDIYAAVKAVESLFNSQADLALLKISEAQNWTLHFDHLAIRCGCAQREDAERVVENLRRHHGYAACQISSENYFQFEDGWDAYVLYKVLENGQQLRLFIDQSSDQNSPQIIQHWNHVYGYTAHHLALRATRLRNGNRIEVPLAEIITAVESHKVKVLTATGQYTSGLLEQVFTMPELNTDIPGKVREHIRQYDAGLEVSIENGKLLELVSRREIAESLKPDYFALYGIDYDHSYPLHTAPVYPYFLPEQAAHVIQTSVQV